MKAELSQGACGDSSLCSGISVVTRTSCRYDPFLHVTCLHCAPAQVRTIHLTLHCALRSKGVAPSGPPLLPRYSGKAYCTDTALFCSKDSMCACLGVVLRRYDFEEWHQAARAGRTDADAPEATPPPGAVPEPQSANAAWRASRKCGKWGEDLFAAVPPPLLQVRPMAIVVVCSWCTLIASALHQHPATRTAGGKR